MTAAPAHRLTLEQARRIAIRAQLLTADRPSSIVETIYGLTVVHIDPTAAIAPSADHILWSRLGWPYQPCDLTRAVEVRDVFEYGGFYRLMADLPLLRAEMATRPHSAEARRWMGVNAAFRRDVLAHLRDHGPARAAAIPDTAQQSWRSTGWTNSRNAAQMLELLVAVGDVAVWGRDAKGRLFDLAERVYPADAAEIAEEDAARERAERRLGALGIAREKSVAQPFEPIDAGQVGESAVVDGLDGLWRIDPAVLEAEASTPFDGRTALLSPFDRLVFDRARLQDLFGFEYVLEMYKPAAARRFGYFALPILHGDRFVGALDAKADRKAGVFRITAIHEQTAFTSDVADAVDAEIDALARWLGLEIVGR